MSTSVRVKTQPALIEQLGSVEEAIGQPLWLGDVFPAASPWDLKAEYPAKYDLYIRLLRSILQDTTEGLELSPLEQAKLELINNFESFLRAEFEFPEGDITLWEYQKELFTEICRHIQTGGSKGWAKLPTGYGKSVVGAAVSVAAGVPSVIVVPRFPLVQDALDAMRSLAPGRTITEFHGEKKDISGDTVVVLYPSLENFNEAARRAGREFPLVFLDEAHLALTGLKQKLIDEIPGWIYQLAVTATPVYSAAKTVGHHFGDQIYMMTLPEGIELGILSGIFPGFLDIDVDLSSVRVTKGGSFNEKDLERAIDSERLAQIARAAIVDTPLKDQYGVIFVPSIAASEHIAAELRKNGITAVAAHGETPNIKQVEEDFENGLTHVLVTPQLLSIGWDSRRVDYGLDLSPTGSWVDKEQRVGRLARKSKFTELKTYLELLPSDPKKRLVTASMILANQFELVPEGTSESSITSKREFLRKLGDTIQVEGVKVVVSEAELEQVALERTKAPEKLSEELAKELLESLPPYVIRDLRRGRTSMFLGFPFPKETFSGTGRSLTRRYFAEVLGEPLSRVDDAAVYRFIQTIMPAIGQFTFLDPKGALSVENLRKIFTNSGITSFPLFSLLGRTGFMTAEFNVEGSRVSGQFLASALSRSLHGGKPTPRWNDQYVELVHALFSDEERAVSREDMLQLRRDALREAFDDVRRLLKSPDAIATYKMIDRNVLALPGISAKAGRIMQNHLEYLMDVPVKSIRTSQMLLFFADIYPELAENLSDAAKRAEERLSQIGSQNYESVTKEMLGQWLKDAGYATRDPFEKYGPSVLLGSKYQDDQGTRTGFRLVEVYRSISGIERNSIPPGELVSQMMDELVGPSEEETKAFTSENILRFFEDAGLTPEYFISKSLSSLLNEPITANKITVSLARLIRMDTWLETGRMPIEVKIAQAREWLTKLMPELAPLFKEQDVEKIASRSGLSIVGNLEALNNEERELITSTARRSFRAATFYMSGAEINGLTLSEAVEHRLRRIRLKELRDRREAEESAPGEKKEIFLSTPRRLSPAQKKQQFDDQHEAILNYLFPDTSSTLPEPKSKEDLASYLSVLFQKNHIGRDVMMMSTFEELLTAPLRVGSVAVSVDSILMPYSKAYTPGITRMEALSRFIEEIEPGILEERKSYWTKYLKSELADQGIEDCRTFLAGGTKNFWSLKFGTHPRIFNLEDIASQVLSKNVISSDGALLEIAQHLYPEEYSSVLLVQLANSPDALSRLLRKLSFKTEEEIRELKIDQTSLFRDAPSHEWKSSDVRKFLEDGQILPPGIDFTERDLVIIAEHLESISVYDKHALARLNRARELSVLRINGECEEAIHAYIRGRKQPTYSECKRMKFLIRGKEYSGLDILNAAEIENAVEFNWYVKKKEERGEVRPGERFSRKKKLTDSGTDPTATSSSEGRDDASKPKEEAVLFLDPKENRLSIEQKLVYDLALSYLGEEGEAFDRTEYTIGGLLRTGESLRIILEEQELLEKGAEFSTSALLSIIDLMNFSKETEEFLKKDLLTLNLLGHLDRRAFIQVLHLASKAFPFGEGENGLRKLWGLTVVDPATKQHISAPALARYLTSVFEADLGATDWLVRLLPKIIRYNPENRTNLS